MPILGLERAAALFLILALLITTIVVREQLLLRSGDLFGMVMIFYRLFIYEDYLASYLLIAVLLLVTIPPLQRLGMVLARRVGERPAVVALIAGVAMAVGAVWVYQQHPLAMDESSVVLQAKIFAHGELVGRYPPELIDRLIYPPFQETFIQVSRQTGEVASGYWPGFALLLTPFAWAGIPWLCNPVLGALCVWVIHRLTYRLTESVEAAGAAALFAVGSAALVINAMSFYSMNAVMLCDAIFALLLFRPTPLRCVAAGFAGGLALVLHSPLPHALFAAAWLIWLFVSQRDRWKLAACVTAGYLPWLLVGFAWMRELHHLAPAPGVVAPGALSRLQQLAANFRPPTAAQWLHQGIGLAKLWLWTAPLSVLLAGMGFWRHRHDTRYRLLLASVATVFLGYLWVPFDQGHGWGFRYLQAAWFVIPVFAAAAIAPASQGESAHIAQMDSPSRCTLAGSLCGLAIMIPFFAWRVHGFISEDLKLLPTAAAGQPKVVLINPASDYYSPDLIQNDPFLREPVIRMVSRGRSRDEQFMAQQYPDLTRLASGIQGSVWGYAPNAKPKPGAATQSPASSPGTAAP